VTKMVSEAALHSTVSLLSARCASRGKIDKMSNGSLNIVSPEDKYSVESQSITGPVHMLVMGTMFHELLRVGRVW